MAFVKRKIKSKKDITYLLSNATEIMEYDENGGKYYFYFHEKKPTVTEEDVTCTVMYYGEDKWTVHRKGETYCDAAEQEVVENDLLTLFWNNRKEVNKTL